MYLTYVHLANEKIVTIQEFKTFGVRLTEILYCFPGMYLQVCGKSQETCCGENSEVQLVTAGRHMYDDKLQTSLKTLSVMYKEKAAKFDGNYT